MPNIGGPREAKRRLVASVVNSKLLYATPIWTSTLNNHAILKTLFSAQRGVVIRIVSAYRTLSTSAVLVLASVPTIDLLAEERKETFQLRKELICSTNLQEIARAKEAICKDESSRYCGSLVENSEHTLFVCARSSAEREAVGRAVGAQLTSDTMVSLMLQSEQIWMLIESFVTLVMKTRELDGRAERGNNGGRKKQKTATKVVLSGVKCSREDRTFG